MNEMKESTFLSTRDSQEPMTGMEADDCIRSSDIPDSDDEATLAPEIVEEAMSLVSALSSANGFKDAGNSAFKRDDYKEAGERYGHGISVLDKYQKGQEKGNHDDDVVSLLSSLHGNNAMVLMKLENWNSAIVSATAVLKLEKNNIKALFRRGCSYHKVGLLEESRSDLSQLLELEATNTAAVKELAQVLKSMKDLKQKEKAAFSNMFKKNIYGDKEAERIAKEKREEIQREKENDEWIKSKLARRSAGKEELSFDDWKKEKKESEEKKIKDRKDADEKLEKEKAAKIELDRRERTILDKIENKEDKEKDNESDQEYDEEDNKVLRETKKKGYCYFKNEQSSESKALIGDITPKTLQVTPQGMELSSDPCAEDPSDDAEIMKVSSWNHAGTWEERDMTEFSKNRITALCLDGVSHSTDSVGTSTVRACVTGVKSIEGEAQIVMARGKKRFIYDFNVMLDIEVTTDDLRGDGEEGKGVSKAKTFKGTLSLPEISPGTVIESTLKLKKTIPASLDKNVSEILDLLRNSIHEKMNSFEVEFKSH